MKTTYPIVMKQMALERECHEVSIYAKNLISDQFSLVSPERLTYILIHNRLFMMISLEILKSNLHIIYGDYTMKYIPIQYGN